MTLSNRDDGEHAVLCPQSTGEAQKATIAAGASNRLGPLAAGSWELVATVATFVRQGDSDVTATGDIPSSYLPASSPLAIFVSGADDGYVATRSASGDGVLYANPR